jgi:magnesium transporter
MPPSEGYHLKKGTPPGSLVYTGNHREANPLITLIQFKNQKIDKSASHEWKDILTRLDEDKINWINIDGLTNIKLIEEMGKHYKIEPLVLEDILNVKQLPKFESHDHYLFFTLKMIFVEQDSNVIEAEQISFIVGKDFIISFQEAPGDLFEPIRQRIGTGKSKVCSSGPDYLLYRLLDVIVDNYYMVIESVGDDISKLELELLHDPAPDAVKVITLLKRKLIILRKFIHPVREALRDLYNDETVLVAENTSKHLTDVMDHINHIIQDMEVHREILTGFIDIYNSFMSQRMNSVMKTLTVITTIFIPLTFIVGVYGMNFKFMPELAWQHGYAFAWILMIAVAGGTIFYIKRMGWWD